MALILRNCRPDGSSKHGFVWDTDIGAVNVALDWIKNEECGNGLHGWLNGIGNSSVSEYNNSNLWLVLEVDKFVDLWDKVKFQSCIVKFKGTKSECSKYLYDNGVRGKIIGLSGEFAEAGDLSNLFGSDNSTLTAGDYSTLKAGGYSTLKAGYNSTLKAGDNSTLKTGNESNLTAGVGSVIITRWYDNNKWNVATFVISESQANKTFLYCNGKQTEIL